MAISSADDADDDIGAQQSKKYRPAVGCKLPESIIDEVLEIALAAQVPRIYDSYSDIPVPWTHLTTPRWNEKVSALVDLWADCEDNVRRAEACVGRPALKTGKDLVRIFGLFELRERLDSKDWIPVPGGLGDNATSAQTVVFVALTDLTPANGFFMTLKKGEDICLDSNADIRFPAPGGGLGVSFVLEL